MHTNMLKILLITTLIAIGTAFPTQVDNEYDYDEDDEARDGEKTLKILGQSVVTSVSVVMQGQEPHFTDAAGYDIPRPMVPPQVASPINLLTPDRYEFYTFDDSGQLIKRLMTMPEIQSIVAGGDGDGNMNYHSLSTKENLGSATRAEDVLNSVKSVLTEEMEAQRNITNNPVLDTPDVSSSWSMILPAIFGNTGDDIVPHKPQQIYMTPDSDIVEPTEKTTKATTVDEPKPLYNRPRPTPPKSKPVTTNTFEKIETITPPSVVTQQSVKKPSTQEDKYDKIDQLAEEVVYDIPVSTIQHTTTTTLRTKPVTAGNLLQTTKKVPIKISKPVYTSNTTPSLPLTKRTQQTVQVAETTERHTTLNTASSAIDDFIVSLVPDEESTEETGTETRKPTTFRPKITSQTETTVKPRGTTLKPVRKQTTTTLLTTTTTTTEVPITKTTKSPTTTTTKAPTTTKKTTKGPKPITTTRKPTTTTRKTTTTKVPKKTTTAVPTSTTTLAPTTTTTTTPVPTTSTTTTTLAPTTTSTTKVEPTTTEVALKKTSKPVLESTSVNKKPAIQNAEIEKVIITLFNDPSEEQTTPAIDSTTYYDESNEYAKTTENYDYTTLSPEFSNMAQDFAINQILGSLQDETPGRFSEFMNLNDDTTTLTYDDLSKKDRITDQLVSHTFNDAQLYVEESDPIVSDFPTTELPTTEFSDESPVTEKQWEQQASVAEMLVQSTTVASKVSHIPVFDSKPTAETFTTKTSSNPLKHGSGIVEKIDSIIETSGIVNSKPIAETSSKPQAQGSGIIEVIPVVESKTTTETLKPNTNSKVPSITPPKRGNGIVEKVDGIIEAHKANFAAEKQAAMSSAVAIDNNKKMSDIILELSSNTEVPTIELQTDKPDNYADIIQESFSSMISQMINDQSSVLSVDKMGLVPAPIEMKSSDPLEVLSLTRESTPLSTDTTESSTEAITYETSVVKVTHSVTSVKGNEKEKPVQETKPELPVTNIASEILNSVGYIIDTEEAHQVEADKEEEIEDKENELLISNITTALIQAVNFDKNFTLADLALSIQSLNPENEENIESSTLQSDETTEQSGSQETTDDYEYYDDNDEYAAGFFMPTRPSIKKESKPVISNDIEQQKLEQESSVLKPVSVEADPKPSEVKDAQTEPVTENKEAVKPVETFPVKVTKGSDVKVTSQTTKKNEINADQNFVSPLKNQASPMSGSGYEDYSDEDDNDDEYYDDKDDEKDEEYDEDSKESFDYGPSLESGTKYHSSAFPEESVIFSSKEKIVEIIEISATSLESNEHEVEYFDTDDDNSLSMKPKILTNKKLTDTATLQFEASLIGSEDATSKPKQQPIDKKIGIQKPIPSAVIVPEAQAQAEIKIVDIQEPSNINLLQAQSQTDVKTINESSEIQKPLSSEVSSPEAQTQTDEKTIEQNSKIQIPLNSKMNSEETQPETETSEKTPLLTNDTEHSYLQLGEATAAPVALKADNTEKKVDTTYKYPSLKLENSNESAFAEQIKQKQATKMEDSIEFQLKTAQKLVENAKTEKLKEEALLKETTTELAAATEEPTNKTDAAVKPTENLQKESTTQEIKLKETATVLPTVEKLVKENAEKAALHAAEILKSTEKRKEQEQLKQKEKIETQQLEIIEKLKETENAKEQEQQKLKIIIEKQKLDIVEKIKKDATNKVTTVETRREQELIKQKQDLDKQKQDIVEKIKHNAAEKLKEAEKRKEQEELKHKQDLENQKLEEAAKLKDAEKRRAQEELKQKQDLEKKKLEEVEQLKEVEKIKEQEVLKQKNELEKQTLADAEKKKQEAADKLNELEQLKQKQKAAAKIEETEKQKVLDLLKQKEVDKQKQEAVAKLNEEAAAKAEEAEKQKERDEIKQKQAEKQKHEATEKYKESAKLKQEAISKLKAAEKLREIERQRQETIQKQKEQDKRNAEQKLKEALLQMQKHKVENLKDSEKVKQEANDKSKAAEQLASEMMNESEMLKRETAEKASAEESQEKTSPKIPNQPKMTEQQQLEAAQKMLEAIKRREAERLIELQKLKQMAAEKIKEAELLKASGSLTESDRIKLEAAEKSTIEALEKLQAAEKTRVKENERPLEKVHMISNDRSPETYTEAVPLISHNPNPQFTDSFSLISSPGSTLGLEKSTQNLSEGISEFADLCNELALSFWKSLEADGISTVRSLVVSPFAVSSMLSMLFLGARGSTSSEMNEVLKLDDMVTFNPHLVLRNVTDSVEIAKDDNIAAAAFVRILFADRNQGKISQFFKEKSQQFYSSHVEEVSFNSINDIIRRRTNLLVKRHTHGKIAEYLKTNNIWLSPPLASLSINIFQTNCAKATVNERDGEMFFQVSPAVRQRRLIPIPAVVYKSDFIAGYDPTLDATAVAFGNSDDITSTIFLMPGQQGHSIPGDSLERLEKAFLETAFTNNSWKRILKSMAERPGLEVQIPRFSHKSLINTTNALHTMGFKDVFDSDKADLRGLTESTTKDLHLSDILQINTFSTCGEGKIMDQHHVEIYPAPALRRNLSYDTSNEQFDYAPSSEEYQRAFDDPIFDTKYIELPLSLRPRQARIPDTPRLKFDRPFLYFVRQNPTGLILFMGRFNPRLLP